MKKITIFLLTMLTVYVLQAQNDSITTPEKTIPSTATLKTFDGKIAKGWFYEMSDSQVILLDKGNQYRKMADKDKLDNKAFLHPYRVENIQSISLHKKRSGLNGFLIGMGTGVLTGAIIGFASGSDRVMPYPNPNNDPLGLGALSATLNNAFAMSAGEKALVYATGLGTFGGLTGLIIGSVVKKKFIIGGSRNRVRDLDGELRKRLLMQ